MTYFTKEQIEWMAYKRKLAYQDKSTVSLSEPPWEKNLSSKLEVGSVIERTLPLFSPKIDIS